MNELEMKMTEKQLWRIGLYFPNVPDELSEELFSKVTKVLYDLAEQYPNLKGWQGFKHHEKESK